MHNLLEIAASNLHVGDHGLGTAIGTLHTFDQYLPRSGLPILVDQEIVQKALLVSR